MEVDLDESHETMEKLEMDETLHNSESASEVTITVV